MTDLFSTPRTTSDAELITAVRDGDDGAYAELYRRHLESAKAAARSLTRSRADADDVVAEGFTRVLQAIRKGGGPQLAFRPYLVTAVRNAYYDRMRKDKRIDNREELPEVLDLAVLRQSDSSDDRALAARAFASLPERWQLVLWHTEVEGRTPAEVGPLLGLAPNAAAALAYRAREGLRQAYLQAHLQQPIPAECAEIRPQLGAYVRDGLSMRDRRKVDAHLETCKRCEELVGDLHEANTTLRAALIPLLLGVPAATYLAHLGRFGGGIGVAGFFRRQPSGVQAVAAAAAAVVTVGSVAVGVNRIAKPPAPAAAATATPVGVTTSRAKTSTRPPQQRGRVAGASGTLNSTVSDPVFTLPDASESTFSPDQTIGVGSGAEPTNGIFPLFPTSTTRFTTQTTRRVTATTRPRATATPTRPATTTTATTTTTTTTAAIAGSSEVPTTVAATAAPTAPAPTTAATTAPTTVTPAPQVALVLTAPKTSVAGLSTYLSVKLTNSGNLPFLVPGSFRPAAVNNPVVKVQLPPGVTFEGVAVAAADTPWNCTQQVTPTVSLLTCTLQPLNGQSTARAQLELRINPDATIGTLPLTATAEAGGVVIPATGSVFLNVVPPAKVAPSGGTPLFYGELAGGLAVIGNSSVTCDDRIDPVLGTVAPSLPSCPDARTGNGGVRNNRQANVLMPTKVLDGNERNSSSANLTIPDGATISRAFLVWSGETPLELVPKLGTPPAPKLIAPSGSHSTYATASDVTITNTHVTAGTLGIYESVADVTAAVKEGGAGTYTVADITTLPLLPQSLGGWSLFVVYADPAAPVKTIAVIDQYATLVGLAQATKSNVAVGGITPTPPDGSGVSHQVSLAYFANEGDLGRPDSSARSTASVTLGSTALGGQADPYNPDIFNVFNSSIVGLAPSAGQPASRNPDYVNNFGIDVDRFDDVSVPVGPDGLVNVTFSADTNTDRASVGLVAFVIG